MPAGAASSSTSSDSRTIETAASRIITAIAMLTRGSAICQPKEMMQSAARITPNEDSASASTWRSAARTFRPPPDRISTPPDARLNTRPAVATSSVIPPFTVGGSDILCRAAYSVAAAISTSTSAVGQRGQDLGPLPAEGVPAAGRPARHPPGQQRQQQRGRVGQHVAGVGQQRQAAARQAAQHLRCEHGQRQPQGDRQPAATAVAIGPMVVVPVVVGVRHAVSG